MNKKYLSLLVVLAIAGCNSEDKIYVKDKTAFCSGEGETRFCLDMKNQPITGILRDIEYDGSGEIAEFKNGKLNGVSKAYYENGNLKLEVNFKDGKKNGLSKEYYENGKLIGEANFKDDKVEVMK